MGGWTTFLLHWGGSLLGGVGAYGIGRWLGRWAASTVVGDERVRFWTQRLGTHASFGVVVLLQIALQSEIPGYVLGTLRYRFGVLLSALALGTGPYAVGTVYLGQLLARPQAADARARRHRRAGSGGLVHQAAAPTAEGAADRGLPRRSGRPAGSLDTGAIDCAGQGCGSLGSVRANGGAAQVVSRQ